MTIRSQSQVTHDSRSSTQALALHLRDFAGMRVEEALNELPAIARRVRTLLVVLAITIPVFAIGLIAVLWRLAS